MISVIISHTYSTMRHEFILLAMAYRCMDNHLQACPVVTKYDVQGKVFQSGLMK